MGENNYRIKIKYPTGFEIEIEGSKDFVLNQKNEILNNEILNKLKISEKTSKEITTRKESIKKLMDIKNNIPYLKLRIPELDIQSVALIVLTAYKDLFSQESVSAITLSKSLKLSGYITKRLDRIMLNLIKENEVISIGSKRKRFYSLTDKGLALATVKIHNITENLSKD